MTARAPSAPLFHADRHGPGAADELVWVQDPYLARMNLVAQTSERGATANNTALSNQVVYYHALKLLKGTPVNKFACTFTAAGAQTLFKWALFSPDNVQRAVTGNESANATAGTPLRSALAQYIVPVTDWYVCAVLAAGGAGPVPLRGVGHSVDTRAGGTGFGYMGVQTGQADMPSTAAINFAGASMLPPWIGLG